MKKLGPLFLSIFIFCASLGYLNQKVCIYTQAYNLSNNYRKHNELIDKRDYLMYSFSKEVSLAKVNTWAQTQNFTPVNKDKIFALNTQENFTEDKNTLASLFDRFLSVSASTPNALAKEK